MELWWRGRAVVVLQSQAGATPLVAVPLLWLVAATLPIVGVGAQRCAEESGDVAGGEAAEI